MSKNTVLHLGLAQKLQSLSTSLHKDTENHPTHPTLHKSAHCWEHCLLSWLAGSSKISWMGAFAYALAYRRFQIHQCSGGGEVKWEASRCSSESAKSAACQVLNCAVSDLAALLNAIFGSAGEVDGSRLCRERSLCRLVLAWEPFIYCIIFISITAGTKSFIHQFIWQMLF